MIGAIADPGLGIAPISLNYTNEKDPLP